MARKKVKLAFIVNDSQRRATFRKRREGLMKKVSELSTLCGIDACAILYSPYENQVDVWPSHSGAHRVISKFQSLPERDQMKNMINNENFIRQRIEKANEQLKKQIRENREEDVTMLMNQCLAGRNLPNLSMEDLNDLGWVIEQNVKEIKMRIENLKKGKMQEGGSRGKEPENVALQGEKHGMDFIIADEDMPRPRWFTEWMNAQSDQMMRFGHVDESTMQFNGSNNHGSSWPGSY